MTKRSRLAVISTAVPALLVVAFFATARYGDDHHGIHYMNRPPIANVAWGPNRRFIVQQGINVVPDPGKHGAAGNVIEFPISRHTRVSMRLLSIHWIHEEFGAWESDHRRIAQWINPCPPRPDCRRLAHP
ncbi:MAG TPA: hypothetical protein VMU40_16905 [Steroidobacteraceae bacterium]|nr:hypothetical protein [Steroidobacteraceae bacterium]